jgi:hypothetical protein
MDAAVPVMPGIQVMQAIQDRVERVVQEERQACLFGVFAIHFIAHLQTNLVVGAAKVVGRLQIILVAIQEIVETAAQTEQLE